MGAIIFNVPIEYDFGLVLLRPDKPAEQPGDRDFRVRVVASEIRLARLSLRERQRGLFDLGKSVLNADAISLHDI